MFFLPKIFADSESPLPPANVLDPRGEDNVREKSATATTTTPVAPADANIPSADTDGDSSDSEAQDGVKNIESAAKVWSKTHIIMAYML